MHTFRRILCALVLLSPLAQAEEGMWLLDQLPLQALKDDYQFEPQPAWRERLQNATLRLAGGCSASFVSPSGLLLTNHHCIRQCLAQLSSREQNLFETGFQATRAEDERICPEVEIHQLIESSDISPVIAQVVKDLAPAQAAAAREAALAELQTSCAAGAPKLRCEVVSLYGGSRYALYRYRRHQDVRLAFAPEAAIAHFGGDPDNFSFPRYALDMSLLRIYEDGRPLSTPQYFPIKAAGARRDELVFVTGHPGATQRDLTVTQLTALRDLILPQRISYLAELRGVLRQFAQQGPEQQRISRREYLAIENALKSFRGRHTALSEPGFMEARVEAEKVLRKKAAKHKLLGPDSAKAWDEINQAQQIWRDIYAEYSMLELMRGYQSDLLAIARHLVRAAQERPKPDAERLQEYADTALPQLTQHLFSAAPIPLQLEELTLGWSLEKLREQLRPDHPAVQISLGAQNPMQVARDLVRGTRLHELDQRKALWDGGIDAINASSDPMIRFARLIDGAARAIRQRHEQEVEAVIARNSRLISQARYQVEGDSRYPEASFTLRLSYGQVRGWQDKGRQIDPFTSIAGILARATGQPPFALPASWSALGDGEELQYAMNFVSSNDIIGGNSGSPVLNREGELVGLVFDGNMHSLGGAYAYDGRYNRAIAVHPQAIRLALQSIYHANRLAEELFPRP